MTGRTISVDAQWALHGKTLGREGYRILRCSDGDLTRRNFDEALQRFLPGTPDELPQVSVSWLRRGDEPGVSYLALAIHRVAEDGQGDGGREIPYDDDGRQTMVTSYFCVPYARLAGDAVTYQAMYEAFRAVELPGVDGPPKQVAIPVPGQPVHAPDDMALRVAALLVTGRPVCVLGAQGTSTADRLRFIDTVMALLPYGMRSRMAAATWTRSTYRDHRFRLFFSSSARENDQPDHVVTWGHPERISVSPEDGYAHAYLGWLEDKVAQPAKRLSGLTAEIGFGQVSQWLDFIGITGPEPSLRYAADGQDLLHPERMPPPQGSKSYVETILRECVRQIARQDTSGLKSSIAALETSAKTRNADDQRARYQEVIAETRLLGPDVPLGRLNARFYDALLQTAFDTPLSYDGYCQLEDCLGNPAGHPPHPALLEAAVRTGTATPLVTAIVLKHLGEKRLTRWFRSGEVNVAELITYLAFRWERPEHARIVCDVTLQYLREEKGHYDLKSLRLALRQHGYLAPAFQSRHPDREQYQVHALWSFLYAAYPGRLDRYAISQVLAGTDRPPTPALYTAVLMLLARPADALLAEEAFVAGLLTRMPFSEETRNRIKRYVPVLDPPPKVPASGTGSPAHFTKL